MDLKIQVKEKFTFFKYENMSNKPGIDFICPLHHCNQYLQIGNCKKRNEELIRPVKLLSRVDRKTIQEILLSLSLSLSLSLIYTHRRIYTNIYLFIYMFKSENMKYNFN